MFALVHSLMWKAKKLFFSDQQVGSTSLYYDLSLGVRSASAVVVIRTPPELYGSIFTSVLLVKVVWGEISGHTCRASVSSSPSLTGPFDGIQLAVGTYIKPFLVRIPRLGSPILPFPLVVIPWTCCQKPPRIYFVQIV